MPARAIPGDVIRGMTEAEGCYPGLWRRPRDGRGVLSGSRKEIVGAANACGGHFSGPGERVWGPAIARTGRCRVGARCRSTRPRPRRGRPPPTARTARAESHRFWLLSDLHAHTNAPQREDLTGETLRPRKRPGRARTECGVEQRRHRGVAVEAVRGQHHPEPTVCARSLPQPQNSPGCDSCVVAVRRLRWNKLVEFLPQSNARLGEKDIAL